MSQHQIESILRQFRLLFNICKFLGVYPHDFRIFQKEHNLHSSRHGTWLVCLAIIIVTACYTALIRSFADEDSDLKKSQSTLTFVIGIFLTYIGLVMMGVDQVTAIRNQGSLNDLYTRIQMVDVRLHKENIVIENGNLSLRIRWMLIISIAFELCIMGSTYVWLINYNQWASLLWFFSCIPTFYNTLDKIWFAVTLFALKERFRAINEQLDELVVIHERYIQRFDGMEENRGFNSSNYNTQYGSDDKAVSARRTIFQLQDGDISHYGVRRSGLGSAGSTKVAPITHSFNSFGEEMPTGKHNTTAKTTVNMVHNSQLSNIIAIEEKLTNICQMHDELCEIAKTLNDLWSYPLLLLMGYGFLIFTAQLYFLYCATQEQPIPSLFRSAKNAIITAIYLSYTSGKCIYLIYLSWRTTLQSKRTGVCIHKCCIVADNEHLYEAVNHLSLKLLNHSVNFSACGFFSLDMEMLYGVSGGITSYLIILIQFNLAAQQARETIRGLNNFNETANMVAVAGGDSLSTTLPIVTTIESQI